MNCPICNRPLKSKRSIERGIGPVCETKIKNLENQPPEGQLKIDDFVKE
ncbi:DUF6011 domain-containing protein [Heyndrickxia sporothermodurans]|uniref:Uncharacterized protein n=1 Tax=Heyndrickxia sporothermodurans TaxID=46224 RepID=A0AB37HF58_9BACI|nr:DUF6011 domain-containing protein [Heyndrickxia sporothermodurans]MBL5767999.1 hypothetical protein [Heyndrickxia sporothermodurans]MBL5771592.1 hypothetical protein [Heyndrickxia sporothermodurans]MBL5785878.1 hypothetical protein [Heyndrickxia sporothermodurans]MBL5789384.1 hypothetical protein [Heyndrickxia sporothermodurans]MBL5796636.1 hypothetical protein [Heyndrickxia sporothermodurans]